MSGIVLPELRSADAEIAVEFGLIPENNIFQFITLCVVAHNKTLVILSTLVHHLTEEFKGGEGRAVILVDALAVVQIRLTQDKDVVHVRAQHWRYTERILHSDEEEHLHPSAVQEEIADIEIACP